MMEIKNGVRKVVRYAIPLLFAGQLLAAAPEAERIYLSGTGPDDAVEWEFYCSKGRQSDEWTTIPVPSNWEQHGFGNYNYGRDDDKHDETGLYRTTFFAPEAWKGKHVRLVFEGSMTQTEVKINGESIGAPNLGGYTPFRYNLNQKITFSKRDGSLSSDAKVRFGEENTLEVLVKKQPDNDSLDMGERWADYWVFGGIYRPVYLEVQPPAFIDRVAIDARADGTFRMDVFPQVHKGIRTVDRRADPVIDAVRAQVQTLAGEAVGEPISAPIYGEAGHIQLNSQISEPALWSPENPNLYQVEVSLLNDGEVVFTKRERFGFRTIALDPESGLYLNGEKILIRGINRNMFDPQHARTISKERAWQDARAIKAMNVNLVRSHLPPTLEFMRACDELGLMVIAELTNWHSPVIDTPISRNIAYEIVSRYHNHPSVILWANGNEGGFNLEVDQFFHLFDLQNRTLIHPYTLTEGLLTSHYPSMEHLISRLTGEHLYLPTEMLHGLYAGGHGAGLDDFWEVIRTSPLGVGGVLWCWADAAIARTDLGGKLDTAGNLSADGIVGPNGEKEGSYFTVREIWSPVQIDLKDLPSGFSGALPVENRYDFTSLAAVDFQWRLLEFSGPAETEPERRVWAEGHLKGPAVGPGESGELRLPLPAEWASTDALELVAIGTNGMEIMRWSWPVAPAAPLAPAGAAEPQLVEGNPFVVRLGDAVWSFSPQTGQLIRCSFEGEATGLGRGPELFATGEAGPIQFDRAWDATAAREGDRVVIEARSRQDTSYFKWTLQPGGLVELSYSFAPLDVPLTSCAVGFDLPEESVLSKRWLGAGPYRVWGNRMKGPQYGLWENEYNDAVTGHTWEYPEFKGIFDRVDWMRLDLRTGAALVLDTEPGSRVGILRPANRVVADDETEELFGPKRAVWDYPEAGGLFLFHKVPAIGTKFRAAIELGPQSLPETLSGPIRGRVVFRVQ